MRLKLFRGMPISFGAASIYSPTVDEISNMGEELYHVYLILATFDKSKIGKLFDINSPFDETDYEFIMRNELVANYVREAISFFVKEDVFYNSLTNNFYTNNGVIVDISNYYLFADKIAKANNVSFEDNSKEMSFKSDEVKSEYEELLRLKRQHKSNDTIELKDMCSFLCHADGNGINIFNVGQLTIYQVHEHLEVLFKKEYYHQILGAWQNGCLKDASVLKDWKVRSKL